MTKLKVTKNWGDEYKKRFYLVRGDNVLTDDEIYTRKTEALKEAKARGETSIAFYNGSDDDQMAFYRGEIKV